LAPVVKEVEKLAIKEAVPEAAPKPKIPEPVPEDETFEERDRAAVEKILSELEDTRQARTGRRLSPAA
jgi:hypothetical protein